MTSISKRLLFIADLIDNGSFVIDVGADHALLDIYLDKVKNCDCLAIDKSKKCMAKALDNIKKANSNVKYIINDGLLGIDITSAVIVIAGMGTREIKKILDFDLNNTLILETHTDVFELLEFLNEKGYKVYEYEVFDKRNYKIIKAVK